MKKIFIYAVAAFLAFSVFASCQSSSPAWTGYWIADSGELVYISPEKKDKNATGDPQYHYLAYFWSGNDDEPWIIYIDDNLNWIGIHEGGGQWRYDSQTKTLHGEGYDLRRNNRINELLDAKMGSYRARKKAARAAAVKMIGQNPWIVGRWKADNSWELVVNKDGTAEIRMQGSPWGAERDIVIISDREAVIDQEPPISECIINWSSKSVSYSEMGDESPMWKVEANRNKSTYNNSNTESNYNNNNVNNNTDKNNSYNSNNTVSGVPGIYPEGSTRELTHYDLSGKSKWQLKIMRNEIYARHNYIFTTQEMKEYFSRQSWYHGYYSDGSAVYRSFSDIEKANVDLIKRYEK